MTFTPEVYEQIREGCKRSAAVVVPRVMDLVKPETVVDVGGGEGWWGAAFALQGASVLVLDDSVELESHIGDVETFWPGAVAHRHVKLDSLDDIMVPTPPAGQFDLAVCLEVGEHLPEEYAEPLVNRLCELSPVCLFSAAIPNQGGHGHVNEQWPSYWRELFSAKGRACTDWPRWAFWTDERVEPWYRQNMLLFGAVELLDSKLRKVEWHLGCDSVVHPDIYGWRVAERDALRR